MNTSEGEEREGETNNSMCSAGAMQTQTNNKKSLSNLGRAASPPLTVENNYATKSPLVTMGCPHSPPKLPFALRRSLDPSKDPSIDPYIDRPHHHSKRQPDSFSRCTPSGVMDRPSTDRHTDRQMGLSTGLYQEPLMPSLLYGDCMATWLIKLVCIHTGSKGDNLTNKRLKFFFTTK